MPHEKSRTLAANGTTTMCLAASTGEPKKKNDAGLSAVLEQRAESPARK